MLATAAFWKAVSAVALAVAVIYVAAHGLHGHHLERSAADPENADRKQLLLQRAKNKYASASLQKPWVLWLFLAGSAVQFGLELAALVAVVSGT